MLKTVGASVLSGAVLTAAACLGAKVFTDYTDLETVVPIIRASMAALVGTAIVALAAFSMKPLFSLPSIRKRYIFLLHSCKRFNKDGS